VGPKIVQKKKRGEKGKSLPTREEAQFVVETVNAIGDSLSDLWTRENRCAICGKSEIVVKRVEGARIRLYCEIHKTTG
jgi:hypothetical protein